MRCPFCGDTDIAVKDSRTTDEAIRRRRVCNACGSRFTTFEHIQLKEIDVIKRSGIVQPFDREKLKRSILKSVHKRQVSPEQVDKLVTSIVRKIELLGESEIKSPLIGDMVLESLNDPVSYVRFASIYQDFQSVDDFVKILNKLQGAQSA